jgi:hypothetical protein
MSRIEAIIDELALLDLEELSAASERAYFEALAAEARMLFGDGPCTQEPDQTPARLVNPRDDEIGWDDCPF